MNGMNKGNKIRTMKVNERGQIVIPEDIRKDMGIAPNTVMVLMVRGKQILLRREEDLVQELDDVWRSASHAALERAWDDEDKAWDQIAKEGA
jgi:AbrB family looped-hinge helix DNA binding protein